MMKKLLKFQENNAQRSKISVKEIEYGLGFLLERQLILTIIRLLNKKYLIDIQHLDRRILSSDESYNIQLKD
ncbi:unnamed protein product [Rotaria socialis]|uniref:Uncharacterized protein n=1 Tax=Rotaria socialis TaxID=392032 RepID=A0A820PZA4_9BILA|nr:unnamed protein product [Rotaria socialis]CAF3328783.1 unnamed protein product [Rotaria socialis]CAF3497760.1 unnamed protein product [Rotaria socialis]CAF3530826.1 unnamed protein product [Rotaria socialis]CAF3725110.1 unnamed protein product [Rotaria socialis]